jgi:type III pantothenate kinase
VSKLLLTIDVGNTHTAVGVFKGASLVNSWRLSSTTERTSDELWLMLETCLNSASIDRREIAKFGISSVVPGLTEMYCSLAKERLGLTPVVVSADTVPQIKIDYQPPRAVGADRLCSAVAGFRKYGGPLIIIDLGTATVFDVIGKDGAYLGGLIAPGLNTAVDSLHEMTAALPRVELSFPDQVIGKSTIESIQSGVLYGAIEMIDGVVRRIQEVLGVTATVIATGGFSGLLKPRSVSIEHIEPNLVLEGIRLVVESQ